MPHLFSNWEITFRFVLALVTVRVMTKGLTQGSYLGKAVSIVATVRGVRVFAISLETREIHAQIEAWLGVLSGFTCKVPLQVEAKADRIRD